MSLRSRLLQLCVTQPQVRILATLSLTNIVGPPRLLRLSLRLVASGILLPQDTATQPLPSLVLVLTRMGLSPILHQVDLTHQFRMTARRGLVGRCNMPTLTLLSEPLSRLPPPPPYLAISPTNDALCEYNVSTIYYSVALSLWLVIFMNPLFRLLRLHNSHVLHTETIYNVALDNLLSVYAFTV